MDKIRNDISMPFQWVQPKAMPNRFEMRSGEKIFATLAFSRWKNMLAQAESADGQWTFERVGTLNHRVLIRRAGEDTKLGEYAYVYQRNGRLELAGAIYCWKATNFWATQFNWLGPDDQPLIHYRLGVKDSRFSDWFKIQSRMEIYPAVALLPDPSLLVLCGWYLMVLERLENVLMAAASDWRIIR